MSSPDLAGKVAIVTGASSKNGIGWNIAHKLAINGAKVYIHARDINKAENAIKEMEGASPQLKESGLLHPFVADFANFPSVKKAAEQFLEKESRLDVLVNNAAVPVTAFVNDKTPDGVSVPFAVNYLSAYLLTTTLLPLLKNTSKTFPGTRVVTTTSNAHALLPSGTQLASLADFNQELSHPNERMANLLRYGLSKLANILFAKELQRRFDAGGVKAISLAVHPGAVATGKSLPCLSLLQILILVFSSLTDGARQFFESKAEMAHFGAVSPAEGALTSLVAATDPVVWAERAKYSGAYLVPPGVVEQPGDDAKSPELARSLWTASEEVLKKLLH
ncbi:short-chain dehydrogenase reductase sdr [Moniliophthora roreri MCA 2997]|uniref:Short-chain dehydrogenase reductase sdr n=1 Tax=Moniliophthora roreri (strain MCA 2997) TaxID=1381753 RepID=V2WS64_MONRO|nr:short-chain dehydrogenase reductase sdr [Moniliophthora roreri MCA 2997]